MKTALFCLISMMALSACEEKKKEPVRRVLPTTQQDNAVQDLNWDGNSDKGNDVISISN